MLPWVQFFQAGLIIVYQSSHTSSNMLRINYVGVHNATGYKVSFHAHDHRPDILHLVNDTFLHCISLSEGDIIHLKQNMLQWWNLELKSNKHKWPDDDLSVPSGST